MRTVRIKSNITLIKQQKCNTKNGKKELIPPDTAPKPTNLFIMGLIKKHKNVWKTFRTNFNNEKELISKQKTLIEKI